MLCPQLTGRASKASPSRIQSILGRICSSNVRTSICSSKLGICLFEHLTLPFADILSYFHPFFYIFLANLPHFMP